jgi:hypothetical protein
MISKKEQANLRSTLFRHLDGIATAPTAYALHTTGITTYLIENKEATLDQLCEKFKANSGYLNVALRICASQGWLLQTVDNSQDTVHYKLTKNGEVAFNHFHLYEDVVALLKLSAKFHARKFEEEPFLILEGIFKKYTQQYGITLSDDADTRLVQQQILKHIEGLIVGPTIVHLGMSGMFHKYFMEANFKPEEFHVDSKNFQRLLDIFTHFGWFKKHNDTYQFTETGLFFAKRASAYGVTVSYIPTFRKLDDLIFGNPKSALSPANETEESHVDREMNVWGSGGAHTNYFKIVDEIIIDLFNKPIAEQPLGILDMGCGNGAFLQHLYNIIELHTLRGKMLDEHPLMLVGADYNQTAIKITKANLIQADIWAKVVWGDIGRPDLLAKDLSDNYDVDLKELLNVRTFLDHNRIWKEPVQVDSSRASESTGAFATKGLRINNNLVEESMLEHIKNWEPYVKKFGLLLIELHTVNPAIVANNLGKTASTAYDATHGYSDQYIVEVEVFHKVLAEAGLFPAENTFRKFPNSELATVTINLFKSKN